MMEIMLPMTEYTGQLRGLGAGVAAKGKVIQEDKEKIIALAYLLQTFNKKLQNNMTQIIAKYPNKLPADISNELSIINKGVKAYISFTQRKLLKDPTTVNSDEYFDRGTKLISNIIQAYNTSNQAILEDSKGWF